MLRIEWQEECQNIPLSCSGIIGTARHHLARRTVPPFQSLPFHVCRAITNFPVMCE